MFLDPIETMASKVRSVEQQIVQDADSSLDGQSNGKECQRIPTKKDSRLNLAHDGKESQQSYTSQSANTHRAKLKHG
jgi:hypothetical protein